MAQAARLNLRMQKELKLLLADPPPGACFPHLSPTSDLSSFSLAVIDAQIKGPEGTVYEKGIFKLKIQIPERYPFQPPVVTFSTPIYHPNIDTGGRICLDILNLPPKGAWQPSLNISTVLTSIGLLMSEPNPDDGLMCEASREYKYNKQAFDQKARSMTEKYARSDASPNRSGLQSLTDSSMIEAKAPELAMSNINEYFVGFKKLSGISRKLSLDASGSNTRDSDMGMNEAPMNTLSVRLQIQEPNQDSKHMASEYSENHGMTLMNPQGISLSSSKHHDQIPHQLLEQCQDNKPTTIGSKKLCLSGKNLQVEVLDSTERTDDTMPPGLDAQKGNLFIPEAKAHSDLEVHKESPDRSCLTNPKCKKLGLTGKRSSLGFLSLAQKRKNDYKGSIGSGGSNMSKMPQVGQCCKGILEENNANLGINSEIQNTTVFKHQQDSDERSNGGILQQEEELCASEAVIVLDSEDEGETMGTLTSRCLIARKRLLGKWKAKR